MEGISFIEGENQFSPSANLFRIGPLLLIFFLVPPAMVLNAIILLIGIVFGSNQLSGESFIGIGFGIVIPKYLPNLLRPEINAYSIVRVLKNGLIVRVFARGFDWKFIPWKDVIDVMPSPRVFPNGLLYWVIKINALEETHNIIGKKFGDGTSPAILLGTYYKNRDKLMDIINENIRDG